MSYYIIPEKVLNEDFLRKIESGEICEDVSIEFKVQEYDLSLKDTKKNMLRDVSAMINSKGGVIFLGISDDGELEGVEIPDLDLYKRQFLQVINACIEPQITGIDFKAIVIDHKMILCVLVPSPANKPYCHKVPQSQSREFLIRNNGINHHLSMSEIRRLFLGQANNNTQTWEEWKKDIVEKVKKNEWLKPLMEAKSIMVFVTPQNSNPEDVLIETETMKELSNNNMYIWPPHSSGCTRVPFVNGLFALGRPKGDFGQNESCFSFVVADNNSSVYFYDGMPPFSRNDSNQIDPAIDYFLLEYAEKANDFLSLAGFEGYNYQLSLVLLNARGYRIVRDTFMYAFPGALANAVGIQKDIFEITADFRVGDAMEEIAKPILDKLWQTSGFDRSFNYDESGKLKNK